MVKILIPFDSIIPPLGKLEKSERVEMTYTKLFPASENKKWPKQPTIKDWLPNYG